MIKIFASLVSIVGMQCHIKTGLNWPRLLGFFVVVFFIFTLSQTLSRLSLQRLKHLKQKKVNGPFSFVASLATIS